jgi:hypothetical protein
MKMEMTREDKEEKHPKEKSYKDFMKRRLKEN